MAAPTFAEVWAQIKGVVKIYNDLKTAGGTYLTNLDAYQQVLEGDAAIAAANAEEATRAALSSILAAGSNVLRPHFRDLAKVISSNQFSPEELMDPVNGDLFQYFITNAQSLNSRNIAYGAPTAAAGNVGNGTIYQLTTDRNGGAIETVSLTARRAECILDSNNGADVSQEVFEFKHDVQQFDELDRTALSAPVRISASGPENSLIRNGSFEEIDGTTGAGGLNSIPGWTIATGTLADFEYDSVNFYATSPTERENGTSYALKIKNNAKIVQKIRENGITLDPSRPYILMLRYNREVGASDGTLTIRMGTASASVALSTQVGWNSLALTLNQNLWYSNFKQDDLKIEIELAGWTTGFLLVDWVIFDAMKEWDGLWYLIEPGSTPFQKGDTFTWTHSLGGTEGIIQYWLSRWYRRYLPHDNAGTETILDP